MEDMIQDEIKQLCASLDNQLDHPLSMDLIYNVSVVNALWTLMSGSRFELNDPDLMALVHKMDELVKESGNATVLNMFPWVRHIAPRLSGWTKNKGQMFTLIDFIGGVISKHVGEFESNKEAIKEDPKDFIDAFLSQIDTSEASSSFHGEKGMQNLKAGLLDLLFAGIETTSTALTWATLFMIKHPDIQNKVRDEIINEVGTSRPVGLDDRPRLPFTEAVIQEVLRMSCIAPLGVPHYAQEDIHVGQYTIPKGTTVFSNLHRVINNPKVFPEPRRFNPQRFLDKEGKYVKNDHNIIFSVGEYCHF
jgi:cytochrome P450 family 2 subfamily J